MNLKKILVFFKNKNKKILVLLVYFYNKFYHISISNKLYIADLTSYLMNCSCLPDHIFLDMVVIYNMINH